MKKSDIAAVILIAAVCVLLSYFVAKMIFGDPQEESAIVKVADTITEEIAEPSEYIFNDEAINPTVEISIGEGEATDSSEDDEEGEDEEEDTEDDDEISE